MRIINVVKRLQFSVTCSYKKECKEPYHGKQQTDVIKEEENKRTLGYEERGNSPLSSQELANQNKRKMYNENH